MSWSTRRPSARVRVQGRWWSRWPAVVFLAASAYGAGDITAGLLATAAQAGPAFEGAAIRCRMRAANGAVEVVMMAPARRQADWRRWAGRWPLTAATKPGYGSDADTLF